MSEDIELYNPDKILIENIKSFNYEVMEPGKHIWAAFYLENGRTGHLNIFSNGGKLETRYEEWGKLDD
jgi:hypothetical protein